MKKLNANKAHLLKEESMKVFISWSGHKSFEVAKVLKEWIPCVIQGIEPYFSAEDIDKGARWSTDIAKELEAASFGILCVTKDNLESQWLNFEAGALSKAIDKAKVCPFLFDLKPSDIAKSPILQFQMTNVDRDDIYKLFQSMNECLGEERLEEELLKKMFSVFWPKMNEAFGNIENVENEIQNNEKGKSAGKNKDAILEELLELVRTQQMLLRNPENLLPQDYLKSILTSSKDNFKIQALERVGREEIQRQRAIRSELMVEFEKLLEEADQGIYSNDYVIKMQNVYELLKEYISINNYIYKKLGLLGPSKSIYFRE